MIRRTITLLMLGLALHGLASVGRAEEKNTKRLLELVAKFPAPAAKDGKLAEVDKKATDAAVAELLEHPETAVVGLVDLLSPKGHDTQARHALHAVVICVGGGRAAPHRPAVANALASTLKVDRPKEIQAFVLRELQLIGGEQQVRAVGLLLLDADLAGPAAQTLLALKTGSAEQFRAALPRATGRQRTLIIHGLGTLRDKAAAESLRTLLDNDDRDTRLTAAWALARIGDGAAAEHLVKLADAAKGYERSQLTEDCLSLAETLADAGNRPAARHIYRRLHDTRSEPSERHVKEAAARGLRATQ
jgi:HEAT repeat protein